MSWHTQAFQSFQKSQSTYFHALNLFTQNEKKKIVTTHTSSKPRFIYQTDQVQFNSTTLFPQLPSKIFLSRSLSAREVIESYARHQYGKFFPSHPSSNKRFALETTIREFQILPE
jgi:hypothetical protein